MRFSNWTSKISSALNYIGVITVWIYLKKLAYNLMPAQSFGIVYFMGSVFARIKFFFDHLGHKETNRKSAAKESVPETMKEESEGVERGPECEEKDISQQKHETVSSRAEADEKVALLEEQLSSQRRIMEEHQTKIHLLEDLIKRQCLLLKENDDAYITYEQLAKSSTEESKESANLWARIENLLNSMLEKKDDKEGTNPQALVKIKREFEAQRLQLEQHDLSIKRHEEDLEEQLAKIETMREILDENSNHTGIKTILQDHERRLTALEDRMALYEKQVEKRLLEQHQLLVFTWIGLITTFVLCFAIVCSCCWFR